MNSDSVTKNFLYNVTYQLLLIILPLITTPYISRVLGSGGGGNLYIYLYNSELFHAGGHAGRKKLRKQKHSRREGFTAASKQDFLGNLRTAVPVFGGRAGVLSDLYSGICKIEPAYCADPGNLCAVRPAGYQLAFLRGGAVPDYRDA